MSFTEEQKVDIRFFLGYPDVYRQSNPRLENAIDVMGTRPATQAKIEVLLAKLNTIYGVNPGDPSSIDKASSKAGVTMVKDAFGETVEFGSSNSTKNGSSSSAILNDINIIGKQLAGALSSWVGVPIASNVFGTAGYVGDKWKFSNGNSSMSLMDYLS